MRLPTTPTNQVVEHLNSTYFHQVWNAPHDNGRANFPLFKVARGLQTGLVPVGLTVVGLPTTGTAYGVYQTSSRSLGRFVNLPADTWIKDSDIYPDYQVSFLAYTGQGRVCPSGQLWFLYQPLRNQVLVAIERPYLNQCTGEYFPDLYMSVYKDTTRSTPIVSRLYTIGGNGRAGSPAQTVRDAIIDARLAFPKGTTVALNGWIYDPNQVPALQIGDVVAITSDPDIVGYVDITIDDNLTGYSSTKYPGHREILHIPKALNPHNFILSSDTLTTVVFNAQTQRGVMGHRVDEHAVESITHNDFSMGRTALQAFSQALGASVIKVRLYVRFSKEPNVLSDDVNHLSDLYSLSDAEILKQLLGTSANQITEWRASQLEHSRFLELIYKFNRIGSDDVVPQFAEAMGYYDVASVLGQQIRKYTYRGAEVEIVKPARLYGYNCQAIVYANGRKVREQDVGLSNYSSRAFRLGFKVGSEINLGDQITVYILEEGTRTPIAFRPTAQNPSITIENEDYTLFQVFTYDEPQAGWETTTTVGYKRVPPGTADYTITPNSNGTTTYTARSSRYGNTYYLIPQYGLNTAVYDLTETVEHGQPLIRTLSTTDSSGNPLPLLGYAELEVYLNGYRLIEGLDYRCEPIEGEHGDILQNLLTVANYQFLNPAGEENTLEVCVHGDSTVSEGKGYVIDNLIHRTDPPMLYTRSSTRVFVEGQLLHGEITESGNVITITEEITNGAPFLLQHSLAFGAEKLLRNVSPNADLNLSGRIENVLGIVPPTYPELVVLDHLYALYSPFLAQIVFDVSTGALVLADEPRNEQFLLQLKKYTPLLERDPTVGPNNTLLNRKFVTLAAHYTNYAVPDPAQMLRVQRLTALMLTPSELSIAHVLL